MPLECQVTPIGTFVFRLRVLCLSNISAFKQLNSNQCMCFFYAYIDAPIGVENKRKFRVGQAYIQDVEY